MPTQHTLPPSWRIKALAYPLFFLALYTVVIKCVNPLVYFAAEGSAQGLSRPPIMWDFWWVIHIFLGICLLRRSRYVWEFAMSISLIEIVIILAKFWAFWDKPVVTFWTLSWYVNKSFVLCYFLCLLAALRAPVIYRELKFEPENTPSSS